MGDGIMKYSLHRTENGLFIATPTRGEPFVGTLAQIREKFEDPKKEVDPYADVRFAQRYRASWAPMMYGTTTTTNGT